MKTTQTPLYDKLIADIRTAFLEALSFTDDAVGKRAATGDGEAVWYLFREAAYETIAELELDAQLALVKEQDVLWIEEPQLTKPSELHGGGSPFERFACLLIDFAVETLEREIDQYVKGEVDDVPLRVFDLDWHPADEPSSDTDDEAADTPETWTPDAPGEAEPVEAADTPETWTLDEIRGAALHMLHRAAALDDTVELNSTWIDTIANHPYPAGMRAHHLLTLVYNEHCNDWGCGEERHPLCDRWILAYNVACGALPLFSILPPVEDAQHLFRCAIDELVCDRQAKKMDKGEAGSGGEVVYVDWADRSQVPSWNPIALT